MCGRQHIRWPNPFATISARVTMARKEMLQIQNMAFLYQVKATSYLGMILESSEHALVRGKFTSCSWNWALTSSTSSATGAILLNTSLASSSHVKVSSRDELKLVRSVREPVVLVMLVGRLSVAPILLVALLRAVTDDSVTPSNDSESVRYKMSHTSSEPHD